jgi:hypothetical protein
MLGGAFKKSLKKLPDSRSFLAMVIVFIFMLLIKMYLVKMSYNIIAPKILKDDNAYKLTMTDALFLVIILMS